MILHDLTDLKDLIQETAFTDSELNLKVKKVFKKSLDLVKENGYRPTLTVGLSFLKNYYTENGIEGMKELLSKISLLVDVESFEYLKEIGIVKK